MARSRARASIVGALLIGTVLTSSSAWAAEDPGTPGQPVDPVTEAQNYSKTNERAAVYSTPEYQAALTTTSAQNLAEAVAIQAADPERVFLADLCASQGNGCAGDIRLNDWQKNGYGIVSPVLFTARSGATLSGHVWATRSGPAKRPGVVITNGSVQAVEQFYWFAAQTLAKAGYVVLTFDPQGQGRSDTPGASPDQQEGVPAQADGRPFFDGTVDALDFFTATPAKPATPRPSCNSGTSHADKQLRRVKAGLNTAFNPYWQMLDQSRIGIAGHSFGAAGVSYVSQSDPRVKAVVAWDNLDPADPTQGGQSGATAEQGCVDASQRTPAPFTKPALGMSADYYIPPMPNMTVPDPLAKSTTSRAYTKAGVDTGEVVIRGGTHYDFDFIPNQGFGATLRGADEIAWYTTAWMDKYVKGDPTADARLLTDRWRSDKAEAAVDPNGDGNLFSFYYRSRLHVTKADGAPFVCEDLRTGCPGMVKDGGTFDYLSFVTTRDAAAPAAAASTPSAGGGTGGSAGSPSSGTGSSAGGGASGAPTGAGAVVRNGPGAASAGSGAVTSAGTLPRTGLAAPPWAALLVLLTGLAALLARRSGRLRLH